MGSQMLQSAEDRGAFLPPVRLIVQQASNFVFEMLCQNRQSLTGKIPIRSMSHLEA